MCSYSNNEEIVAQGIPVSPGIAIGVAHVQARGVSAPEHYDVPESEIAHEKQRYINAIEATKAQLNEIRQKIERIAGETEGQIFEAHLLIIEDGSLNRKVLKRIEEKKHNAEHSFYVIVQTYIESMRRINDPYLSERATDLDDICQRVLRNFTDAHAPEEEPDHQHVLVTFDLAPSDTAVMNKSHVLGFVTEQGSVTSHTAILARSLGIPAIVGLKDAVLLLQSHCKIILDGTTGKIIANPTEETFSKYLQKKQTLEAKESHDLECSRSQKETFTKDGKKIILSANIEFSHEINMVQDCGAEGVGLFRSEFFLLNNQGGAMPSEEEQFQAYKEVAIGSGEHLAIIRTLDSGGDKLSAEPLADKEPNPFLGWRGIRVSLSRPEMFKEQLRAILRASYFGKLGVMFPLISGVTEVIKAKDLLNECKQELKTKNLPFDPNLQVGVMIEVPSAAIMADVIAKEVDFFSIGTNDLVQYTVAVDRVNPHVSHLYRPCNPAVLRLIKMTVDAGKAENIWTGVCGEMAGFLEVIPILIGLGVEELSVGTHQLPKIKQAISLLSYEECKTMVDKAMTECKFSRDIMQLSSELAKNSMIYLD